MNLSHEAADHFFLQSSKEEEEEKSHLQRRSKDMHITLNSMTKLKKKGALAFH